jgi:amino acid permease
MRAHIAQALAPTLTLLLAIAGAVGHGVFLAALLEFDDLGPVGATSGALIGWLVVLALYLIAT